jgi:hypothetical protein
MADESFHLVDRIEPARLQPVLRSWRAAHPEMGVLALLPEAEAARLPALQAVCRDEGVRLVGGIFPALVVQDRFRNEGAWLLRLDALPWASLVPDLPLGGDALAAATDALVAGMQPHLNGSTELSLLLLFDAMYPRVGSMLDELYFRLADRVRYVGANAGSERFVPMPCLFDAERVVGGGALAALVPRNRGAVLEHGYEVPERMITATSTEGNRILQIDWRPAFEVYQQLVRDQYGVEVNRDNFYQLAVHFPFGIVRANGVLLVRIPVALEQDGSLFCVGEVAPNSVLTLLKAPTVDSSRVVEQLAVGLTALAGPPQGQELLLFYCAGRRLHLGVEAATAELKQLDRRLGAARVAGALSLGEIGNAGAGTYPLFHNATLVVSRWGA